MLHILLFYFTMWIKKINTAGTFDVHADKVISKRKLRCKIYKMINALWIVNTCPKT